MPANKQQPFWNEELKLYTLHKKCIENGEWLTDDIMTAGQELLKKAYPKMCGIQSSILGETLTFDINQEEFVPVLNVGKNRWITIINR